MSATFASGAPRLYVRLQSRVRFTLPETDAAMARHSHEIFDSKGASRKVAQWARAAWSRVATETASSG